MFDPRRIAFEYVMKFVGLPYRWGGDDSVDGFDCSGLVLEFLKSAGVVSTLQAKTNAAQLLKNYADRPVLNSKFGTLLFFGEAPDKISHVALALNDVQMLEAGGGDHTTTGKDQAAAQNAFVRVRRISSRKGLQAKCHPNYGWIEP